MDNIEIKSELDNIWNFLNRLKCRFKEGTEINKVKAYLETDEICRKVEELAKAFPTPPLDISNTSKLEDIDPLNRGCKIVVI